MRNIINRRRKFRKKFKKNEKIFGAWTSFGHPGITEILCRAPFDFMGIDMEHSTISQAEAQRIIAAAQANGALCFPRIPTHDEEMIKRLLDSGADGLIIPMISQVEEVQQINAWMKYPPEGKRSYGIARGQGYGFEFENYTKQWNETATLIVQIESKEGVENIDDIAGIEEVDGIMIGPYDLSGSYGIPGQLNHPEVRDASLKVLQMCHIHQKPCGIQIIEPTPENIVNAFQQGYDFLILASDIFLLWKWAEGMKEVIKRVKGSSA